MADRVASESQEMIWLMAWARVQQIPPHLWVDDKPSKYADYLFHIPNEGQRSKVTGGRMKAGGMQKGVPDFMFALPHDEHHGLFIELKSTAPGRRTTAEQDQWLDRLAARDYAVAVCRGWREASDVLSEYTKP